jgi:AcrR family transcriptional regulator
MDTRTHAPNLPATETGPRTKRDAIIDAAAAIFSESGYQGASIDAIAVRADVSRQTVYNQIGDKEKVFKAVVAEVTQRSSAGFFSVLETFPDQPTDLENDLVAFAGRLLRVAVCEPNGRWLLRLLSLEGVRHPELFASWREYGPGRKHPAMAARFAQLAHAGFLDIDDPSLAARQFMALIMSDVRADLQLGIPIPEAELDGLARNAVRTFLRAFARR